MHLKGSDEFFQVPQLVAVRIKESPIIPRKMFPWFIEVGLPSPNDFISCYFKTNPKEGTISGTRIVTHPINDLGITEAVKPLW